MGHPNSKHHKGWPKGKPMSKEHRKAIRLSKLGKPLSEAARKSISRALKGNPRVLAALRKARRVLASHPVSRSTRRKIGLALKGHIHTKQFRAQVSKNSRLRWRDPAYRKKMSKIIRPYVAGKTSKIQKAWWFKFRRFGFSLEVPVAGYFIDLASKTSKVGIEVDGRYHTNPQADAARTRKLNSYGWKIVRVKANKNLIQDKKFVANFLRKVLKLL